MLDKLIAALKKEFENKGYSDATFKAVAEYLEKTVTEESQIADAVKGVSSLMSAFQSDGDRRASLAVAAEKAKTEKPAGQQAPAPVAGGGSAEPAQGAGDQMPAWFKPFADTVQGLVAGKTTETRRSQLDKVLDEAKVTDSFKNLTVKAFDRMAFKDDADFTTYLEGIKTDAADYRQQAANDSLRGTARPGQSSGENGGKQASKEEVAAILPKII